MNNTVFMHSLLLLTGVFISAVSQVMLKKSALKTYDSQVKEYLNPLVIGAYTIFVASTLLSVLAYRGIPLSMGPVLETTGYIYVTIFGMTIFHEEQTVKTFSALALIIIGIIVYSLG